MIKFFKSIFNIGPLGISWRISCFLKRRFNKIPFFNNFFSLINKLIASLQHYLDSKYDRKYGTNTSGVIQIKELDIKSKNIELAIWYEPMSVKVFTQIMNILEINFNEFTFIDFGSGKGRVLLMASQYGFKEIIGVEFSEELNNVAADNVKIYKNRTKTFVDIKTLCEDATNFSIPQGPLVIFFYSPFKGKVMEQVLSNISESFYLKARKIILIFYGKNSESIELFKAMNFHCEEIKVNADWSRFTNYRCFLFMSPGK